MADRPAAADLAEALENLRRGTKVRLDALRDGRVSLGTAAHVATIVEATLADTPTPGLPAVLSSVEDVARVCEAAGLQRIGMQLYADRWLGDLVDVHVFAVDGVLQRATVLAENPATQGLAWHIEHGRGAAAAALWAAIQAARGGEGQ